MIDTTLLDNTEPISMEAVQALFRANDFSTMVSRYDAESATEENNVFYLNVKKLFQDAWNKEMGALTKKNSLMHFSEFYPIRCLEDREEDLVSGTVMELLAEEDHCDLLLDLVFDAMQDHLHAALKSHAIAQSKSMDALTEAMKRSPDKKTFIQQMKKRGYGVTWTEERKYITYTCPNGKKCRGIKLHEEKYKKEMMEYEFAIRKQEADRIIAVAASATERGGIGDQGADPVSAHGVRHPGRMEAEGGAAAGGCGTVPADAVPADLESSHQRRMGRDAGVAENADLSGVGQLCQGCSVPIATGWEEERGVLFGLIQEALRKPTGSGQCKGEPGKNLSQMGADRGGSNGGIFDAGLRTVSAIGRLTEDTDDDEEEQRKRIQGQESGSAVGTALGLAIGALLAIRDEELRKEEAALQEELAEEQNHIWQLSM